MGTTDVNGIYFYEDTDPVSPLHTLLNTGQQSISNKLDGKILPQIVASQAARDALATSFVPRPDKPLYVHRQDTGRFERSIGSGFEVINPLRSGGTLAGAGAVTNVNGITTATHGLGRIPTRITCIPLGQPLGTITEDVARLASPMVWDMTTNVIQFRWRRVDSGLWFGNQGPIVHSWTAE